MKPTEQEIAEEAKLFRINEEDEGAFHGFKQGAQWAISQMQPEWVKCSERLPEVQVPVLVYLPNYGTPNIVPMWIEKMTGNWFSTSWNMKELHEATHWMPLPQLPNDI